MDLDFSMTPYTVIFYDEFIKTIYSIAKQRHDFNEQEFLLFKSFWRVIAEENDSAFMPSEATHWPENIPSHWDVCGQVYRAYFGLVAVSKDERGEEL